MKKLKISILPLLLFFSYSCRNTTNQRPINSPSQSETESTSEESRSNEEPLSLYCKENPSFSNNFPETKSLSIIHKVLQSSDSEVELSPKELESFEREIKRIKDLSQSDFSHKPELENPINISDLRAFLQELRFSFWEAKDKTKLNSYLGKIPPPKDEGYQPDLLARTYREKLKEKLNTELLKAVEEGFFFEKQRAWEYWVKPLPAFQKYLQRATYAMDDGEQKDMFQRIFQSRHFTPHQQDEALPLIQKSFGPGVKIEGIAQASMASVYKVSCPGKRRAKPLAVKVPRFSESELRVLLENETKDISGKPLDFLSPKTIPQSAARQLGREKDKLKRTYILESMLPEVDYASELKNLAAMKRAYETYKHIHVPEGRLEEVDGRQMLVMELIEGDPISGIQTFTVGQRKALKNFFAQLENQILEGEGIIHGDTHKGNIMITQENKVYLVDAGLVHKINPNHQKIISWIESILYAMPEWGTNKDKLLEEIKENQPRDEAIKPYIEEGKSMLLETAWHFILDETTEPNELRLAFADYAQRAGGAGLVSWAPTGFIDYLQSSMKALDLCHNWDKVSP